MAVTRDERVAEQFRWQAEGCRALGSPLSAALLEGCADDLVAGAPTAAIVADVPDLRRRDVLGLR
jgi:hypothetical protein